MTAIHQDQITAAESVLRPFITDPAISVAGLAMQCINAFMDAAPAKRAKAARAAKDEPEGFDEFYAIFPRKVDRRGAANAYRSALTRTTHEIIMAGAKRYAAAMAGTEMKYVKHPATWLNHDCWLDEMGSLTLVGGAAAAFEDCPVQGWVRRLEVWAGRTEQPKGSWRASWGPPPQDGRLPRPGIGQSSLSRAIPSEGRKGRLTIV